MKSNARSAKHVASMLFGFIHCLPLFENTLILVPKGFGSLFKSITDNYKFENILLNGAELEASLAPKLMICLLFLL